MTRSAGFYGFGLRAGQKPNTLDVVDTRNNRLAFVLEMAWIEDIETERDFGEVIIELRVKGRLGVIETEAAE